MKDGLSKRITDFKTWLNPSDQNDKYNEDDFYPGRRAVKRRQRGLAIRRHLILFAGLIVFLLVIGTGVWGFKNFSQSNNVASIQTRIDHLYTDNSKSDLKSSVTQQKLVTLKKDISDLKPSKANKLKPEQKRAQNAFTVVTSYNQLYNSDKLIAKSVDVNTVDDQLDRLKNTKVTSNFRDTYTKQLQSVREIIVTSNKLEKRYKAIVKARTNNQAVADATINDLIKDMKKNSKSEKTIDQRKKLVSLKDTIEKENKQAETDAQTAATAAEQAAAAQAAANQAAAASSSVNAGTNNSYANGTTNPYSSNNTYNSGYNNGYYNGNGGYSQPTGSTTSGY